MSHASHDPAVRPDPMDCGPEACSMTMALLTSSCTESADALEAIETYFERGWSDGLPIVPPTPSRVAEFLDAAGLAPRDVIGSLPTRENVEVTAEKLAINSVMAGAKPEYMRVIVAAMRAMCHPMYNLHSTSATTMGAQNLIIVNGPIRRELGINSYDGAFGPGWRANATIGRAVQLTIRNVLRSVPGEFDRASYSHPGRYGWCFGEDEEESGWPSIAVDRGIACEQSAVTVFATVWQSSLFSDTQDGHELVNQLGLSAREAAFPGFYRMREAANSDHSPFFSERAFLFVTGREHIRILQRAGFDKRAARNELFRVMTEAHPVLRPIAVAKPENILIASVRAQALAQSWFFFPFALTSAITQRVA